MDDEMATRRRGGTAVVWTTALAVALPLLLAAAPVLAARATGERRSPKVQPVGPVCSVLSLDGEWLLATDPGNAGRRERWFDGPVAGARKSRVPWIIQDVFPGYHGVAWYWRDFEAPKSPYPDGRMLLRFWAVDYLAEVWLNGIQVGRHEGPESVFVLDVTEAIRPGARNRLAVRVLNPWSQPIDGYSLAEVPHRNKTDDFVPGADYNHGGIEDSVELLLVPAVWIADLWVRPDPKTGRIAADITVRNSKNRSVAAALDLTVAPAASGETLAALHLERTLPAGESHVEAEIRLDHPRLWNLNDPFLYRVTARVGTETGRAETAPGTAGSAPPAGSRSLAWHEVSTRCGFRDFRFENGYFRLNGRRVFLRGSHTGNCCPIGIHVPHDPDLLRRDLLNVKAMGFNMIRFIAGVATRYQLDLCDEIGLLVYEESAASWCLADSPQMGERYDESILGMVRRDRNHPSVVIWGLLNETNQGAVFQRAVQCLPKVRALDDTRMVFLNSGRWDEHERAALYGLEVWRQADRTDPCVTFNPTERTLRGLGITWVPGQLAFHPGRNGEYSVVRWVAPEPGEYAVAARFASIAEHATTDVHVLHGPEALFDGLIHVGGQGPRCEWAGQVTCKAGDTIDCVVGWGNGDYGADTTGLEVEIAGPGGRRWHAGREFSVRSNPNGPWRYGLLQPGPKPDPATFAPYPVGEKLAPTLGIGSFSNPGTDTFQDVLSDQHHYPRVPHTGETIRFLRTLEGGGRPVFLSEYGIGSALDLLRVVRQYEQAGKGESGDARLYRGFLERFLADWQRWRLDDAFASPEDFLAQCVAKMGSQRLLGINAIRANPNIVGYSLTGTVDQGFTGEGLTTTFRELKRTTTDALFEGLAPLRLCLFAEPVHLYRGSKVRLEAVLANEDALPPGEYPLRVQVVGPGNERILDRTVTATVAGAGGATAAGNRHLEPPFALPVFSEEVAVDGPAGRYRFLAVLQQGGAATGGEAELYVAEPMGAAQGVPPVVMWGDDPEVARWLGEHGIAVRPFQAEAAGREVILAGTTPPEPGGAAAFRALLRRVAQGATVVFLSPGVFRKGDDPVGWLPLARKGRLYAIPSWVYQKDEWAKPHPAFAGLPVGLMEYTFYREIIPDLVFADGETPDEAVCGAFKTSQAYESGLMLAVYQFGGGRFILNTLLIRENLGRHPAADRLLMNLLRYAAEEVGQPPSALPADLEARLTALGY